MIHSLTIQRTTTYEVKVEAQTREEAETLGRYMIRDGELRAYAEDWEYIHPNGTRHFVPEGAL